MLANVALPAFIPHFIWCLLGIFFIAALEAVFLKRGLKLPYPESYWLTLSANFRSTLVGIPVAWIFWLAGAIPVTFVSGLLPFEIHPAVSTSYLHSIIVGGMMPSEWSYVGWAAGYLISLVPFCLAFHLD